MADDLVSQASALTETCRAALLHVVRSGNRAQRTRAREILEADLDRALAAAIADFGEGSRAIADFANRLEPLILELRTGASADLLNRLTAVVDTANRIGRVVRDREALPPISGDGLAIVFRLPDASDETEVAAVKPVDPAFRDLAGEYIRLFRIAALRPEAADRIARQTDRVLAFRGRYEAVGAPLGIPWHFVACIHLIESDCNFTTHLHNGDPLRARTVRVPAGCPAGGVPPFTWEDSARDALTLKRFAGLADWSLPRQLYRWEAYNGFGYRPRGIATPYLWSGTTAYTKGRYLADGRWDPEAESKRIGCAAILKSLEARRLVTL